jgi:ADP-heptose:LPS heptosyltransferase
MIIISPYAKALRCDGNNPKNYPHWKKLISLIDEEIIQVGITGEEQLVDDFRKDLTLPQLSELIYQCKTWISVDSFFQHYAWDLGKPGIVLWGQSDPNIFGHPENINLLKDRKYLREKQFWLWEQTPHIKESFVLPEQVINHI